MIPQRWAAKGAKNILLAAFCFALVFSAAARSEDMPLSEIKKGDKGVGKTVFQGFNIETFNIEVIDILPQAGVDGGDLILIKVSGKNIMDNGGVSLGMSGSPIYIRGKLIGALSIAFELTDGSLGGVTPIENMRRAARIKYESGRLAPLPRGLIPGKDFLALGHAPAGMDPNRVLVGTAAVAPVMVSGLNQRSFDFLKAHLSRPNLRFINSSGAGRISAGNRALKPGGAVGILLTDGDIQISAIGTVTDVDKNNVLVFGHPFLFKGPIQYFLSHAYVHDIVVSLDAAYKLASPAGIIGAAVEDRGAAVVARLGTFPRIIPVEVTVNDLDTKRTDTINVKIVPDRDILSDLLATVLLQSVDQTIDRIGEGTARVSYAMTTDYNGREIKRGDSFYSRFDISALSVGEIYELALILAENIYKEVTLMGLKVNIDVEKARHTATIEKVKPVVQGILAMAAPVLRKIGQEADSKPMPKPEHEEENPKDKQSVEQKTEPEAEQKDKKQEILEAGPGDTVVFSITLKPFREDKTTREVSLTLPQDIPLGTLHFSVRSGADESYITPKTFSIEPSQEPKPPENEEPQTEEKNPEDIETLDDLLDKFDERHRGDEVFIECLVFDPESEAGEKLRPDKSQEDQQGVQDPGLSGEPGVKPESDSSSAEKEFDCKDLKTTLTTNWVIVGEKEVTIKVVER